jgi:hypothetical protein
MNGFSYGTITGCPQATVAQRLEWIRRQYMLRPTGLSCFVTQPYDCLPAAYRQAGQETEAPKVAIAKRVDLRYFGNLNPYRKTTKCLLDKTNQVRTTRIGEQALRWFTTTSLRCCCRSLPSKAKAT